MKELQKQAHETAVKRSKWVRGMDGAILNLFEEVAEFARAFEDGVMVSECYEDVSDKLYYSLTRSGSVDDELADVVIVCMSIAEELGIDLMNAIKLKMKYNEVR